MTNKQRRGGLGRGLGSLIPTAPAEPPAPPLPSPGADGGHSANGVPSPGGASTSTVSVVRSGSTGSTDDLGPDSAAITGDAPATSSVGTAAEAASPTGSATADSGYAPVPGAEFAEIPVAQIHANAKQPRQVFDDDALEELAHSIREFGVLQPVVVRRDTATDGGYELVMGERRLRAAVAAGLDVIPAIVRSTSDDAMLRDALLENVHRAQLNPLEEAAAYQQLLEEFGTTQEELAKRIGRSRPQVSNTIRLLNLPIAVQRRVAAGVLSAGHARALLALDDSDLQDEFAARIVAEGLSVRAIEELVTLATHSGARSNTPRRAPARNFVAPGAADLADRLADRFDTRVRVDLGRRKGKITLEFGSIQDLERIVGLMAPGLDGRRSPDAAG